MFGKCRYCKMELATSFDVREHARLHNYEHEGRPLRDDDTPAALDGLLEDSELVDAFKAAAGNADEGAGAALEEPEKFGGGGGFSGGGAEATIDEPAVLGAGAGDGFETFDDTLQNRPDDPQPEGEKETAETAPEPPAVDSSADSGSIGDGGF